MIINKFLIYGTIVLLCIMIVLLIYQNYQLKYQLKNIFNASDQFLKKGDIVSEFKASTFKGDTLQITYNNRKKNILFFIYSTACPYCEKNIDQWNSISKIRQSTCDIIGIVIKSNIVEARKYSIERNFNFFTIVVDSNFLKEYKVSGVPITLLVSSFGVVENLWFGILDSFKTGKIRDLILEENSYR